MEIQLAQLYNQARANHFGHEKCKVRAPIARTVLRTYMKVAETFGKELIDVKGKDEAFVVGLRVTTQFFSGLKDQNLKNK